MRNGIASLTTVVTLLASSCSSHRPPIESAKAPLGIPLQGRVLYPDGTPAVGATVLAMSNCPGSRIILQDESKAESDGSFTIPSFDETCPRVRFTASFEDEYWLPTGEGIFCLGPTGTSPEIDIANGSADPVTVTLGVQGGELELRVWDTSTDRFVYGGLYVIPLCENDSRAHTTMGTATAQDGGANKILVPAGRYRVRLEEFRCNGRVYFSAAPPEFEFDAVAGTRTSAVLQVAISELETKRSFANLEARKCSQK